MKNVAVEGMEFELTAAALGNVDEGWTAQIATPPNSNMKADGLSVYSGNISVVVAAITLNGGAFAFPSATFTLSGSAVYNRLDGLPLLLEEDFAVTVAAGTNTQSGSPVSDSFTLKVKKAGQDSVKAE